MPMIGQIISHFHTHWKDADPDIPILIVVQA
jgi:hypothetical protein